jgi:hypothetical protein
MMSSALFYLIVFKNGKTRETPWEGVSSYLGVAKERMITVMIEPDDWLTKARQESRRLVIAAGLSDQDIDRLIEQARTIPTSS